MNNNKRVLIVGGGLAGLACARELQAEGISCQVFEASAEVGGRLKTDEVSGFLLDRGFQVLLDSYPEAKKALDYEKLHLGSFEPGALIRFEGRFHKFSDPWRRPGSAISTLFSPVATLSDKIRVGKLRLAVCRQSVPDLFNNPQLETHLYLKKYGFSEKIINHFFRPFFGGVFLESKLETSSRKFEYLFRMFSNGSATLPQSGMGSIPKQLANGLRPGTVELGCEVTAIDDDKVLFADGRVESGDAIVLATPIEVTSQLLQSPSETKSNHVDCHYFAAEKSPLPSPILALNGEQEGPINSLCVPSDICPTYAPDGQSLISVTVLSDQSGNEKEEKLDEVRAQLFRWFGEAANQWSHLRSYRIHNPLPQQTPDSLDPVLKPAHSRDNIFVCGDHMGIASIQGALESGRRAAEDIAVHLEASPVGAN